MVMWTVKDQTIVIQLAWSIKVYFQEKKFSMLSIVIFTQQSNP